MNIKCKSFFSTESYDNSTHNIKGTSFKLNKEKIQINFVHGINIRNLHYIHFEGVNIGTIKGTKQDIDKIQREFQTTINRLILNKENIDINMYFKKHVNK